MTAGAGDVEVFQGERPRLFGLAYRMTGSVADADDIVQEAWLRFQLATDVESPAGFLTTVTSRLAIDKLRSAQHRRETYVGPWLPEPIATDLDPAHVVELDESVTLGFLHVLERLGPVDRAVFLLHDVFGLGYEEVAGIVGRTEDACRQVAHRARERVRSERPRVDLDDGHRRELVDAFLLATASGDPAALERLLADDVVLVSDGGPNQHAARRPVVGRHRVARFVLNLAKRTPPGSRIDVIEVNGEWGVVVRAPALTLLMVPEVVGDRFARFRLVSNPDKLGAVTSLLAK